MVELIKNTFFQDSVPIKFIFIGISFSQIRQQMIYGLFIKPDSVDKNTLMLRVFFMSTKGFLFNKTKSACLPTSIVPTNFSFPMHCAAVNVA